MEPSSILNDVIGPVMRGPSSSHTAGTFRIGRVVRDLLGAEPRSLRVAFDPAGSYAPTYRALGVDVAFAAGVSGRSMTDDDYLHALTNARRQGIDIDFVVEPVDHSDHPNAVRVDAEAQDGTTLRLGAESVGGGMIRCTEVDGRRVEITGKAHGVRVEVGEGSQARMRVVAPLFHLPAGEELFSSAEEMVAEAERRGCSLGQVALGYESELLGMAEEEVRQEVLSRFQVMEGSVFAGLDDANADMLLLRPSAGRIFHAEGEGDLYTGGIHSRAAARAMAVMHTCNSRGVVCAAPTGGSAGVVPGVLCTLVEDRDVSREAAVMALLAGSAVGLIVAKRATFAAETAGCQVEIGVAGAMAAAAVVEVAGGSARQAADAAAVALQNTMGSVCDPVHGACEIPCHTRNALAASSAFVCADLILGGYRNAIPLDETIDASYAVGRALPRELRCTAAGGLAVTPSAQALVQLR